MPRTVSGISVARPLATRCRLIDGNSREKVQNVHGDSSARILGAVEILATHTPYSYRNARIGSTREARTAGINPAPTVTAVSRNADPPRTSGSHPFNWYRSDSARRPI